MSGTVNALAVYSRFGDGSRVLDRNWPGLDRDTSYFFVTYLSGVGDRLGRAIIGPRESRFDQAKLHLPEIGRDVELLILKQNKMAAYSIRCTEYIPSSMF